MHTVFIIKGKIKNGPSFQGGPYFSRKGSVYCATEFTIYLACLHPDYENTPYDLTLSEYVLNGEEITHLQSILRVSGRVGVS